MMDAKTISITSFRLTALSITVSSIKGYLQHSTSTILSIITLGTECHCAQGHAECRIRFIVMLSVILISVILLNVVMLNFIILSVIMLNVDSLYVVMLGVIELSVTNKPLYKVTLCQVSLC
jgi:hypothetical protein